MKTFILLLNLLMVHFAFSNSSQDVEEQKQSLLEDDLLKNSQPTQDLLEVVEEMENSNRASSSEGKISLQLKEVTDIPEEPDTDMRQLAHTFEPVVSEGEEAEETAIVRKRDNLKSLLHESIFEKDRMKRNLDAYIEGQQTLSLDDEAIKEDLGDVEILWEPPEDQD